MTPPTTFGTPTATICDYFCHRTTGKLVYDFGEGTRLFEPWWCLVLCDQGIIDYYCWLSRRYGIPLQKGSAYGAHVSVTRGEPPPNLDKWGLGNGEEVELLYPIAVFSPYYWSDDMKLIVKKPHTISHLDWKTNILTKRTAQVGEVGTIRGYFVVFSDGKSKHIGGNDFMDPDDVINEFYTKSN